MAVRSVNEIMESVRSRLGDAADDDTLGFIEDISDTLNDFSARTQSSVNWEQKYNDLDAEWRKKYKERFFNGTPADPDEPDDPDEPGEPKLKTKFEELFN